MLDHTGFYVKDAEASCKFYDAALAPLGYTRSSDFTMEGARVVGYAEASGKPDFWIIQEGVPSTRIHVCFKADRREQVQQFYEAALANGGTDNGAPGLRKEYTDDYYAAFAHDPDGNNLEVVTHSAS